MDVINLTNPNLLLDAMTYVVHSATEKIYRNGVELEKGSILSKSRIEKNRNLYEQFCEFWGSYPDLFIDLITPSTSNFKLKFFQRLFLRTCLRHGRVLTIAPRASGKSFICILALYLICMFRPKSHNFLCAPGKAQGAKIANEKVHLLWDLFPLLKKEIIGDGNFGTDYIKLTFRNGSRMTVMSPLNSTRGNRANCGIIDEFRDHLPDDISEIILPLLNIDRPMMNQLINPNEPQQVQLWISSASEKNSYCYDKTIEMLEMSIINPDKAFCWGFDYQIPVFTGMLSRNYLNELKLAPTFSETGFSKEYLSRFVGSSNEAWFDYEKLLSRRRLVNPEKREIVRDDVDSFYLFGVDVARLGCQTVCVVLKVFSVGEVYRCNVANLFILGKTDKDKVFSKQALELKKLIQKFNPREVIIDINGLGVSIADEMIRQSVDPDSGAIYPAYGFFNRDEYTNIQPRDCQKILFGIKANPKINSDMHSGVYSKIHSGLLTFLISEQDAKVKLMATKKGQRMNLEDKIARLMPHELTSILINEIMNLKVKPTGVNNQIAVEQINKRMGKDKFSALEMGVYRIIQLEQANLSRRRNRGLKRQLTFYKKGR